MRVKGWQDMHDNDRVVAVVDRACGDEAVGRAVERVWLKRFTARRHHPPMTPDPLILSSY